MKKDYIRKNLDILLFLLGMVPLSWMLLEKCRYGFTNIDESFYLTIPYRLCQGDRLLLNEWHLSQLSGWILRFPMAAFLRINGGTEGICLSFRYLYVAAHLGISLLLFFLLRKKSGIGAAAAVLIFMSTPLSVSGRYPIILWALIAWPLLQSFLSWLLCGGAMQSAVSSLRWRSSAAPICQSSMLLTAFSPGAAGRKRICLPL